MGWCEEINDECPYGYDYCEDKYIVKPVDTTYIDNLMNIAEHFSGKRSWEFYKKPFEDIEDIAHDDFAERLLADEYSSERKARNAEYMNTPEMRVVTGVNYCCRKSSAFKILKTRLIEAIENDETEFSLDDEFTRIKDQLKDEGYSRKEVTDMLRGYKPGKSTISRILIETVEGAENIISIAACSISPYFPELQKTQTQEISEVDAVWSH